KMIIGRDPSCRITLHNPLVSSRHLQLHHDGSGWRATDLGSTNGTWVDGHRVAEVPVSAETRLRLAMEGPEVLLRPEVPAPRVAAPSYAPPPGRPTGMPTGMPNTPPPAGPPPSGSGSESEGGPVLTGIHRLADVGPQRAVLTIGRDASNALALNDLLVSRRHAELRRTAG